MAMNELQTQLNKQVANLNVMYVKLHSYHWYVKGTHFFTLHEKFEEFYNEMTEKMDAVAERLLTIGGKPYATLKDYLNNASIKEAAGNETADQMIKQLIQDFIQLVNEFGEGILAAENAGDHVTADLFISMAGDLEKHIWMLNAYVGEESQVQTV